MKKTIAFVLCAALLLAACLSAQAEIVGQTGDGTFIHRHIAPNGQELYFVSLEREPHVLMEDVNFDGIDDVVVYTAVGASNFFTEFFVWDGEKYVTAQHDCETGLCNYSLEHPGYIVTYAQNGWAGALFERRIYQWEGTHLRLRRVMVSECDTETVFTDTGYTVTENQTVLHIQLKDYVQEEDELNQMLLWETRLNVENLENSEVFNTLSEKIWEGIEE